MNPELENPWSQNLTDYDEATQATVNQLISDDATVRAQYFAESNQDSPAQVIGATGFSGGINMAVSPATGPI